MNLKNKLQRLKNELLSKEKAKKEKLSLDRQLSKQYQQFINSFFENNSIQLTKEQFSFLKELYLKDGYIIGLHNTHYPNVNSFFENGLYNNNYFGTKSESLTNTVMVSTLFGALIPYHHRNYITLILLLPEKIIKGEEGIFEDFEHGYWGIPPEYIVGAFTDGKIIQNTKNYNPNYHNKKAKIIDDPLSENLRTRKEKEIEVDFCEKLFLNFLEKSQKKH